MLPIPWYNYLFDLAWVLYDVNCVNLNDATVLLLMS